MFTFPFIRYFSFQLPYHKTWCASVYSACLHSSCTNSSDTPACNLFISSFQVYTMLYYFSFPLYIVTYSFVSAYLCLTIQRYCILHKWSPVSLQCNPYKSPKLVALFGTLLLWIPKLRQFFRPRNQADI